jgi:hypothetical protein
MQESESRILDRQVTNIPTTKEKFFLEYLMTRKPVIDSIIRKISNGQYLRNKPPQLYEMPMRVLAKLLYYNDQYRDLPDADRWRKVFDYDTKLLIMEKLNISEDNLNSYFSQLRKIRILDGKTINDFFVIYPKGNEFEITFKFRIDEKSNG